MSRYSVWAMPSTSNPVFSKLADAIKYLSIENKTVPFLPHVTVLGGIVERNEQEAIRKAEFFCSCLQSYRFVPQGVSIGDHYFQSVYIKMRKTKQVG